MATRARKLGEDDPSPAGEVLSTKAAEDGTYSALFAIFGIIASAQNRVTVLVSVCGCIE